MERVIWDSVLNACHFLQRDVQLLSAPEQAENCRALILPGVGAPWRLYAEFAEVRVLLSW